MKKHYILAMLFCISILNISAQTSANNQPLNAKPGESWEIKWNRSDNFNNNTIDRTKWNDAVGDVGVWSWDNDNVSASNGTAKITVTQENHTRRFWDGCNSRQVDNFPLYYKSGILKTFSTGTYGYYEARIKGASLFPGVCPAFWLYSDFGNSTTPGDVHYSEVDVVEMQQGDTDHGFGNNVRGMEHNLHTAIVDQNGKRQWRRPKPYHDDQLNTYEAPFDPSQGFHTYGCEVNKDEIIWYVDNVEVGRKANLYWHRPMNVTLSVGMRRQFARFDCNQFYPNAAATTQNGFPTTMEIDYVRVWEKSDTPVNISVTGVNISRTSATLAVNSTLDLNATIVPANATNQNVSWSTNNSNVATVNSTTGLVTAKSSGYATITVNTTDGNRKASCTITVTNGQVATENWNFEDGDVVWTKDGSSSIVSTNTYGGSNYAGFVDGNGSINQTVTLDANSSYDLSAYGKVGGANQSVTLGVTNASTNTFIKNIQFNTTSYSKKTINFSTGSTSQNYRIWFWSNGGGKYYCDNFELKKSTSSLNIIDEDIDNKVEIYPNPTKDHINISIGNLQNASVELYNSIGQLVIQNHNVNSDYRMDLNVNPGVYFVNIYSDNFNKRFKVIVK